MQNRVELCRQIGMEVVTGALRLGAVDDADRSFEAALAQGLEPFVV
jgi:hypothetical protein